MGFSRVRGGGRAFKVRPFKVDGSHISHSTKEDPEVCHMVVGTSSVQESLKEIQPRPIAARALPTALLSNNKSLVSDWPMGCSY